MITFWVPSTPVPQPRQRHRIMGDKAGRQFVANYTPKNSAVQDYKAAVKWGAAAMHRKAPLDGPLSLNLVFILPRPKSRIFKRRPMPREPHIKRPDVDNFVKATLDALTGTLWRDDAQIVTLKASKWVAAGDESPGVKVTLAPLTD